MLACLRKNILCWMMIKYQLSIINYQAIVLLFHGLEVAQSLHYRRWSPTQCCCSRNSPNNKDECDVVSRRRNRWNQHKGEEIGEIVNWRHSQGSHWSHPSPLNACLVCAYGLSQPEGVSYHWGFKKNGFLIKVSPCHNKIYNFIYLEWNCLNVHVPLLSTCLHSSLFN